LRGVISAVTCPEAKSSAGVEIRGAATDEVVGLPCGHTWQQRQHRAERSTAWICDFIDTEIDRGLRRIQVQPHDVAELVDALRIPGRV
jgi:hypothetical protein